MELFSIFAYVAVLLLVALLSTRLMRLIKLPNVTGYIITGIIMGPFLFGVLFNNFSYENIKDGLIYGFVKNLGWVSTVALGFIAFSIGTSFKINTIKALGKRVMVITVLEALGASILVIAALLAAHFIFPQYVSLELALTLAAIASATAPAATLMVIKQYRAHGPLVDTLLPVVALDDAAALILFAILFQIATALAGGSISAYAIIVKPLLEISISLGVGVVLGFVVSLANRFFKSRNNRLIWCIFSVFAALGFYYLFKSPVMGGFELSSLLTCMMAGAIYTNFEKESGRTLDVMDRFTSPIYMMFFVISGASLDLTIFFNGDGLVVVLIAVTYIISRVIGKWSGAYIGASITRCEPQVKKYIGFALVPQAGVAIGLSTTAYTLFSQNPATEKTGALILAIILTSTLVYELIGPMVAKFALKKAHEIPEENL
ncbi:MAG: cation:proton antiporter [Bacilli bacterium]|nr:cation:proton antiporter [Bacilli bacterium]